MHNAFDIAFDRLRTLGIPVDESPDVVIQNVVMSGDLDNQLNLNAVAIGLGLEQVEYEPEQFPGLIFRVDDPDIVALLFGSGRIVVTGAKSPEDGRNGMKTITTQLNELDLLES
jgi:transcription initiation factor TFIID TATA-box-binding protein